MEFLSHDEGNESRKGEEALLKKNKPDRGSTLAMYGNLLVMASQTQTLVSNLS